MMSAVCGPGWRAAVGGLVFAWVWLVVATGVVPAVALGAGWSVVPSPNLVRQQAQLNGVSCVSASACTAVGYDLPSGGYASLAERWNGRSWAIEPTPNRGGLLYGVSCTSARTCTAVGNSGTSSLNESTSFAERWDGTRWAIQPTPQPLGAFSTWLSGVSCGSARSCTAVGHYYPDDTEQDEVPFVEHWNGTRWAIEATPTPPRLALNELEGVSCVSVHACTAVGSSASPGETHVPLVERWNGTRWAIQPTPKLPDGGSDWGFSAVSCVSVHACTAVGTYSNSARSVVKTLAERWDGTRWAVQPTPNPGGSYISLDAVSCGSADACTAVSYYDDRYTDVSFAERWDGTRWAIQPTPNPPGLPFSGLSGVSCTSASACIAVGDDGLIESWTGPSNKFTISGVKMAADGTTTFSLRTLGRGNVDALETAWNDNLARAADLLKPAPGRFVFGRQHVHAAQGGTVSVTVNPNRRGRLLVARDRYPVVLRLWVSYNPDGGFYRTVGFLGLHLAGSCANHKTVAALRARTIVRCN